jgi:ferredoxin-NADP reductase
MDREVGIKAYAAMIPADEYKAKRALGESGAWAHAYSYDPESPVVLTEIVAAERMNDRVNRYVLKAADGSDLPAWEAGAHVDVVIAPDTLRQYSLMGDPRDRSCYQIAVLREDEGRGGSLLAHRIFIVGRRVTVSKPINHFPLAAQSTHSFLMGGGIGVTPMIAMAHALYHKAAPFELHYSVTTRQEAAFAESLQKMPWAAQVRIHVSREGGRADFDALLKGDADRAHVYACGPDNFMQAVMDAAARQGFPPEARHIEYFTVPEAPEYENHPFILALRDGRRIPVPADQSAAEALIDAGVGVDLKCSDGLCGVCKCGLRGGDVEHRDFVLSQKQRETEIILCQSRALQPDGVVELDL